MNEYIKRIEDSAQIIIYGAGKVAMTVYSELQEYGLDNKVICFAVSDEIWLCGWEVLGASPQGVTRA